MWVWCGVVWFRVVWCGVVCGVWCVARRGEVWGPGPRARASSSPLASCDGRQPLQMPLLPLLLESLVSTPAANSSEGDDEPRRVLVGCCVCICDDESHRVVVGCAVVFGGSGLNPGLGYGLRDC